MRAPSRERATQDDALRAIAQILEREGFGTEEARRVVTPRSAAPEAVSTVIGEVANDPKRESARSAAIAVAARFPDKLRCGSALQHGLAAGRSMRGTHGTRTKLNRPERRLLKRVKRVQMDALCRRYASDKDEGHGVWSREVYRRIRAGVQDTSGKAAECLLFMLGTEEAVEIAERVDTRVPMDRRRVALAYAIAMAPGSSVSEHVKMGFALGLWSAVLADPNNPNMERGRAFRPSRRTLSSDLNWLDKRGAVRRWQVPAEVAHPSEMKVGPYPTNRYFSRETRSGFSLFSIAVALGDSLPQVTPNAEAGWTEEDAAALAELNASLAALRTEQAEGNGPAPPSPGS